MNIKSSKTSVNLMRAFAGESQAANRYLFAAEQAKNDKLYAVEAVFKFTAGQERAHAKVFYDFLKEITGETVKIDGGYPVGVYTKTLDYLRSARHNELEEFSSVYPDFAVAANHEGFSQIAAKFNQIAKIEKTHGDRFGALADLLEQGKLFVADVEEEWMCLNCGYIHKSSEAPKVCPVCSHEQGYFIRLSLAPYTTK
ncbi:MAG: rubrerythrin [Porcipelethomonas sp.]